MFCSIIAKIALNYYVSIYIMSVNSKNSLENILTKRLNIPEINKVKSQKVFKKDFVVPKYSEYENTYNTYIHIYICDINIMDKYVK